MVLNQCNVCLVENIQFYLILPKSQFQMYNRQIQKLKVSTSIVIKKMQIKPLRQYQVLGRNQPSHALLGEV